MESSFIGFFYGIAGILIGGIATHFLSKDIARRNKFNNDCSNFHNSFTPTLSFIYLARQHGDRDRPDVDVHIKAALLAHGAAIEMFRPFVPECDRSDYQQAWENYRKAVTMDQYALATEAKIKDVRSDELLEQNIHNILQFAKYK